MPSRARSRAKTKLGATGSPRIEPSDFAWLHHETRLVATGVAARVAPDDVDATLAAIDTDDPLALPGTGALAVGALPFDPSAPGELVIPARVNGWVDGRAWVTEIGPTVVDARVRTRTAEPVLGRRVALTRASGTPRSRLRWPRSRAATSPRSCSRARCSSRPTRRSTSSTCSGDSARNSSGASSTRPTASSARAPSCSCAAPGCTVESRPVAGTTVADNEEALRALAHSAKDNREHNFVVEAIADSLGRVCHDLDVGMVPDVAVFGPVAHLATPIRGELTDPAPSALELARLLHPTPAVGGTPRAAALAAIPALEGFDRGRYAGPVGWVDARGNGEWAIALRCAELDGPRARLVAGAGIVEGSDPAAEWAETQVKLEPMLRALVRP